MTLTAWTTPATNRIYPHEPAPMRMKTLRLRTVQNRSVHFQIGLRHSQAEVLTAQVELELPTSEWQYQVRQVGLVPVRFPNVKVKKKPSPIPGFIPDPLIPVEEIILYPQESSSVYLDIMPPASGFPPGDYLIEVKILVKNHESWVLPLRLIVYPGIIDNPVPFDVSNWLDLDAIIRKCASQEDKLWLSLPEYFQQQVNAGINTLYVPFIGNDCQLLKIVMSLDAKTSTYDYNFDWSAVEKYCQLGLKAGYKYFDWAALFKSKTGEVLPLVASFGSQQGRLFPADMSPLSTDYRKFLTQLIDSWQRFLMRQDLREQSFFQLCNQPENIDHYTALRAMLHEIAPWLTFRQAAGRINLRQYGDNWLLSPDYILTGDNKLADNSNDNINNYDYYTDCESLANRGVFISSLSNTDFAFNESLTSIRLIGWRMYHFGLTALVSPDWNSWHDTIVGPGQSIVSSGLDYLQPRSPWLRNPGASYLVYPGALDSLRSVSFFNGLQDAAMFSSLGLERDNPVFEKVVSWQKIPVKYRWLRNSLKLILKNWRDN